jgi:predicted transcriptional regulator
MNVSGNTLREVREREQILVPALAKSAGVSERTIRRIEEVDGAARLEIKARLVVGLNALIGQQRYKTEDVFPGWEIHRRHTRRKKGGSAPNAGVKSAAD